MPVTKESIMSKVKSLLSDTIIVVDTAKPGKVDENTGVVTFETTSKKKYDVYVTNDLKEVLEALATAIVSQIKEEGLESGPIKAKTLDVTG